MIPAMIVAASTVANELGARRLGSGPRARLRFDLADVQEWLDSCTVARMPEGARNRGLRRFRGVGSSRVWAQMSVCHREGRARAVSVLSRSGRGRHRTHRRCIPTERLSDRRPPHRRNVKPVARVHSIAGIPAPR
jgi:hypothetical protein